MHIKDTLWLLASVLVTGGAAIGEATAREGNSPFILGAEDILAGALPPDPGLYMINYAGYYGGELMDAHGKGTGIDVSATFDAPRFLYMTGFNVAGLQYGAAMAVPVVHQSFTVPAGFPAPGDLSATGAANAIITPIILASHSQNLHWAIGVDVFVPIGLYDRFNPFGSIAPNYWAFEPVLAVTYITNDGWEASAKVMYDIKTINESTNYLSGAEFHYEVFAGKHIDKFTVGVVGYGLIQTTDDELNGIKVGNGNRAQVFSFGPAIRYDFKGGFLTAKWYREFAAENQPQGNSAWLKMGLSF